jgi:hypothetical protein
VTEMKKCLNIPTPTKKKKKAFALNSAYRPTIFSQKFVNNITALKEH